MEETNKREEGQVYHVSGMYKDWFLDYASYVILERAVPDSRDGLKPVQRRILHAMKEMDDGRFHKVANIIGQTMQYHPHGDAAIGDALVNMGQKDLLIDTQGNWGDVRTGDSAAAPRYIEARLSKFALEVVFNKDTTEWQLSYDGRKPEPVSLPVKFPLVLAMGVEGIAVGLSTKILPHNFCELLEASIACLKGEEFQLFPDFATGGFIDVSNYDDGMRGGKVRVRAKLEVADKKTIIIREIPYGTTTTSIIDSILKANDKGKIKIKKVTDNTAKDVEILIELPAGVSPDVTVDALYAFSDCEVSISPICCVIRKDKPVFVPVSELLKDSAMFTKGLLKQELEIRLAELEDKWHYSSLEKIFIENRIYRDIEECETWEAVIETIDRGLDPFKKNLQREVTRDDIVRLTEIKIKRISKYDSFKADELIRSIEAEIKEVKNNLKNLTKYTIAWFQGLLDKFGKGRERKTEIKVFDVIEAKAVVANNTKLYMNRADGFVGFGLKKEEFVCECSDLDDIIVFTEEGIMKVVRIADKVFIGKKIIHAGVWRKDDDRMTYHAIYTDGKTGKSFAKRFNVTSITRDKEYNITQGTPRTKVWYFTANPNGESETVNIQLHPNARAKIKNFDFDFGQLAIKGRSAMGNTVTKYPLKKLVRSEVGSSTLGGRGLWLDTTVGRLNRDNRGQYLGEFDTGDMILVLFKDGNYELTDFELTNRYEMREIEQVSKFDADEVITAIYYEGESGVTYVKRFYVEATVPGKKYPFISETKGTQLIYVSTEEQPRISMTILKGKKEEEVTEEIDLASFIDIKGWKSQGNRLSPHTIKEIAGLVAEEEPETEDDNVGIGGTIEWDLEKGDKKVKGGKGQGELF
ncbi:MAG: DNA gyrase/topoisomerase IV subunit A [Chitinophagales bacterium]|nr:DNA gyrase/topoisomerase IV subunit A [Chitinophagales bacterium]MCB9019920.1 DNA gyrase/topoisomerase IV subunit A [Chitinophagales bacterium]MCB9022405.1 DNA gyrase/topoisomerase IV subunit A [Chitinophagales bacterium]HPE97464.1 DNA gyrase/topoisomerase IV subunit A [Chitinophagales bacterium]HQU39776.1 DNA gyrase/topoisomerase IV subunit A [Chitinophagales bacterium]